ncbi:hypothetical protein GCM10007067_14130 [Lysobacter bugurensis]|uniref:Uncharacterized protein n=1 Tax=Cognatilysobacter bugurensis TaxID=543356 RepID=A0A918SXW1_9GAMM|nr:hypothetical protein GCM10007067_14130 [Lysobacter bugurensis]
MHRRARDQHRTAHEGGNGRDTVRQGVRHLFEIAVVLSGAGRRGHGHLGWEGGRILPYGHGRDSESRCVAINTPADPIASAIERAARGIAAKRDA